MVTRKDWGKMGELHVYRIQNALDVLLACVRFRITDVNIIKVIVRWIYTGTCYISLQGLEELLLFEYMVIPCENYDRSR